MSHRGPDAFIAAAVRTPVGKAPNGQLSDSRPDDLLSQVITAVLGGCPAIEPADISDLVVGCAMPEGEQGNNIARIAGLLAGLPDSVPAVTVNRFCASGLQAVAWAADRIRLGEAELVLAGGVESMSRVPMGGYRPAMNPKLFSDAANLAIAFGMGITAERVASRWAISRQDQDQFALASHHKALKAIANGEFDDCLVPVASTRRRADLDAGRVELKRVTLTRDEGPRPDTSIEALAHLRPAFAASGTVTAGNSSQMSDGAAALLLASEAALKRLDLEPLARFVGYTVAGVAPEVMGIGPVEAVPAVLRRAGLSVTDIDWYELNEAFAAQSLAVIRELDLDPDKVNPQGGAIALGHPLGATGAIRTTNLVHGLRRTAQRYGMVTLCVGTGMGAAAVFEAC